MLPPTNVFVLEFVNVMVPVPVTVTLVPELFQALPVQPIDQVPEPIAKVFAKSPDVVMPQLPLIVVTVVTL